MNLVRFIWALIQIFLAVGLLIVLFLAVFAGLGLFTRGVAEAFSFGWNLIDYKI